MSKIKRITFVSLLVIFIISLCSVNVSAATVSDGIKAEIQVLSQDENTAEVEAVVKNANYYEISGINCALTVSGNGALTGETQKTDLVLAGEESEQVKAVLSVSKQETETQEESVKPAEQTGPTSAVETVPKDAAALVKPSSADQSSIKTGENPWLLLIPLGICVFAGIFVFAVRKKNVRIMSLLLCGVLAASVASVSFVEVHAEEVKLMTISEQREITLNGETVTLTFTVEYPEQPEIHDNSLEDLKAINGDKLDIVYNDKGEISFLNGSYTHYKVTNWETAVSSLRAVETLFNIKDNDITVLPVYEKENENGDTYYTFQQNVGAVMLSKAFITVGADKDGNTLCISSSLQPEAGTVDFESSMITAEQAETIVDALFANAETTMVKVEKEPVLDLDFVNSRLCWVLYRQDITSDPDLGENDNQYYKIYVTADTGQVISTTRVTDWKDDRLEQEEYDNDYYFQKHTTMMQFTDYQGKQVELPVAQNDDGSYYFCDTQRRILCVDTAATQENNFAIPVFYEFQSADEVPPIFISVFENIRKVYDYYAENGIVSIDGDGIPLMVGLGIQENGVEIENAYYLGNLFGWGIFMFSEFPISTGLDVAAHEFTHGVKRNITGYADYQNVSGAVEEGYADIMGNMTEMLIEPENADMNTWLIAETTGKPIRCMADPHLFAQPEFIGDAYYLPNCTTADSALNDFGGVHVNNSILSKICYSMWKNGISLEDNYTIWLNTFLIFNPNADYDDVCGYVKYAAERADKEQYVPLIQNLFEDANVLNAETFSWDDFSAAEGYSKVTFVGKNIPEDVRWSVCGVYDNAGKAIAYEETGNSCTTILKQGGITLCVLCKQELYGKVEGYYMLPLNDQDYNYTISENTSVIEFDYNELIPR